MCVCSTCTRLVSIFTWDTLPLRFLLSKQNPLDALCSLPSSPCANRPHVTRTDDLNMYSRPGLWQPNNKSWSSEPIVVKSETSSFRTCPLCSGCFSVVSPEIIFARETVPWGHGAVVRGRLLPACPEGNEEERVRSDSWETLRRDRKRLFVSLTSSEYGTRTEGRLLVELYRIWSIDKVQSPKFNELFVC